MAEPADIGWNGLNYQRWHEIILAICDDLKGEERIAEIREDELDDEIFLQHCFNAGHSPIGTINSALGGTIPDYILQIGRLIQDRLGQFRVDPYTALMIIRGSPITTSA